MDSCTGRYNSCFLFELSLFVLLSGESGIWSLWVGQVANTECCIRYSNSKENFGSPVGLLCVFQGCLEKLKVPWLLQGPGGIYTQANLISHLCRRGWLPGDLMSLIFFGRVLHVLRTYLGAESFSLAGRGGETQFFLGFVLLFMFIVYWICSYFLLI